MSTPLPPFSAHIEHFGLDRSRVFLNHGSFGATPLKVLDAQNALRRRVELEPIKFFVEDLEPMLDEARRACAQFINVPEDDFAFVTNATAGVNTVVKSLRFGPGDELLIGNHEYNACNNAFRLAAGQAGATVVSVDAPFPIRDSALYERAVMEKITERTRLVLLSHITSPTGLILPVERLIPAIQSRGIDVLLDSAHGAGFVHMDIARLAPAYATGNFHKWTCAPKGSAFLYVRPDKQHLIHPLILSHGFNVPRTDRTRYRLEFDYPGSFDASAWITTPLALEFVSTLLPGGVEAFRASNNALCLAARNHVCNAIGVQPTAPDQMLGAMAAIALPTQSEAKEKALAQRPTRYMDALQDALLNKWKIQIPIFRLMLGEGYSQRSVRICRLNAMVYNSLEQFEYLARALKEELAAERAI